MQFLSLINGKSIFMFELQEIMRQKDSKTFVEILNCLGEGKSIKKDRETQRLIEETAIHDPVDVAYHLVQNKKVNEIKLMGAIMLLEIKNTL